MISLKVIEIKITKKGTEFTLKISIPFIKTGKSGK